jgi:hypothetical protein
MEEKERYLMQLKMDFKNEEDINTNNRLKSFCFIGIFFIFKF